MSACCGIILLAIRIVPEWNVNDYADSDVYTDAS